MKLVEGRCDRGIADDDGDKAFDTEEFPVPGLPAMQVVRFDG